MASEEIKKERQSTATLTTFSWVCIVFGISIISFTFFQWDLVEYLTPFLVFPLLNLFWIIFAILVLASFIYIPFQIRKISWKAFLPFLVNGITFFILYLVPFTSIRLNIEFTMNKKGYEEVIQMTENGKLQPNENGQIELPLEYQHLSKGGEIMIDTRDGVTSVFFYTYRGVLDNFSGYMYRSNDIPPLQDFMGGDWAETTRKDPHWYFCASL